MRATSTLLILMLFVPLVSMGTLLRVNNNPSVADEITVHSSLADVLANHAAPGDTVLLESSDLPYDGGLITLDISLTIFGTGYFLEDNDCTQADVRPATIEELQINAPNARVAGIHIGTCNIDANQVRLMRCYITEYLGVGTASPVTSVYINGNFIEGSHATALVDLANATNITLKNNFIHNTNAGGAHNCKITTGSGVILNNLFFGEPDNLFHNAVVQNNYFELSEIDPLSTALTVSYNLASSTFLTAWGGAGNNNFGGLPEHQPDTVYCFTLMDGVSRDGKYQLNAWNTDPNSGNPAENAGADGNDIGMFSGTTTYVLSGMPPIPSVARYNGSIQGTQSGGTSATVKGKSRR
ncbi:MAG: hypothetical protein KDC12_06590 [Flavobacteriales bacterium]|nr:hypothetical protein [Flavobacteriales bacterium]